MSIDHSQRLAAQDHRNEVARLARHEREIRSRQDARWKSRVEAIQNTVSREPESEWDGALS